MTEYVPAQDEEWLHDVAPHLWCPVHGSRPVMRIGPAARWFWSAAGIAATLRCGCNRFMSEDDPDFAMLNRHSELPYAEEPTAMVAKSARRTGWNYYPNIPKRLRRPSGPDVYTGRDLGNPVADR